MRPRCSVLAGGFGSSDWGDGTCCPSSELAEISNSEPSAIVLQGMDCMRGVYKFRYEWKYKGVVDSQGSRLYFKERVGHLMSGGIMTRSLVSVLALLLFPPFLVAQTANCDLTVRV